MDPRLLHRRIANDDRQRFLALAARALRRALVDHAGQSVPTVRRDWVFARSWLTWRLQSGAKL